MQRFLNVTVEADLADIELQYGCHMNASLRHAADYDACASALRAEVAPLEKAIGKHCDRHVYSLLCTTALQWRCVPSSSPLSCQ